MIEAAEALDRFRRRLADGFYAGACHRPSKPYVGFPLFAHVDGRWKKKIGGQHVSFGLWHSQDDPERYRAAWKAALAHFERFDQARARGEVVGAQPRLITLDEIADRYLAARERDVRHDVLALRTFVDVRDVIEAYKGGVGAARTVEELERDPKPLRGYLDRLRGAYGWSTYNRRMRYITTMWRWAAKPTSGTLNRPFHWLELHAGRSIRERRRQLQADRARGVQRVFSIDELRLLIENAPTTLRASILVAIFCAYGNQDVAELPRTALTLFDRDQVLRFGGRFEVIPAGWGKLDFPRPKTMQPRQAIVPALVVNALRVADATAPMRAKARHLLLRSEDGTSLRADVIGGNDRASFTYSAVDNVAQQFKRLLRRAGTCERHGLVIGTMSKGGRIAGGESRRREPPCCPACGGAITCLARRGFYAIRHTSVTLAAASGASSDARDLFTGHAAGTVRQEFYIEPAELSDLALIARELLDRLGPIAIAVPEPTQGVVSAACRERREREE